MLRCISPVGLARPPWVNVRVVGVPMNAISGWFFALVIGRLMVCSMSRENNKVASWSSDRLVARVSVTDCVVKIVCRDWDIIIATIVKMNRATRISINVNPLDFILP